MSKVAFDKVMRGLEAATAYMEAQRQGYQDVVSSILPGISLSTKSIQKLFTFVVAVCLAFALCSSYHWPLVGDMTLMHYVIFLTRHGMAPYRDIVDVNLPGSYFFEALGMGLFGGGSVGWRLYDTFLMLFLAAACYKFAARLECSLAGVFAAALFWLVHLQDGIFQAGQRDLLMATLLMWSYVVLEQPTSEFSPEPSLKPGQRARLFFFGLLMGTLVTIKPVLLPLQLALILHYAYRRRNASAGALLMVGSGFAVPLVVVFAWLWSQHAIVPFWDILTGLLPLHSSLGKQKLSFLLVHALAPFALLILPLALLQISAKDKGIFYRQQLVIGIAGSLIAYITQGKGYPYHRYPLLLLFLVAVCIELFLSLTRRPLATRVMAVTTCLALSCLVAPQLAYRTYTFSNANPFQNSLESALTSIDSPRNLSGNVECLDTFGGCIGTLYDLKIVQASGYLYDCYLFSPPSDERTAYRLDFLKAFEKKKPSILVLTNQFCFGGTEGFSKVDKWPEFAGILNRNYELQTSWRSAELQHWWSRKDEPTEYRIYRSNMSSTGLRRRPS